MFYCFFSTSVYRYKPDYGGSVLKSMLGFLGEGLRYKTHQLVMGLILRRFSRIALSSKWRQHTSDSKVCERGVRLAAWLTRPWHSENLNTFAGCSRIGTRYIPAQYLPWRTTPSSYGWNMTYKFSYSGPMLYSDLRECFISLIWQCFKNKLKLTSKVCNRFSLAFVFSLVIIVRMNRYEILKTSCSEKRSGSDKRRFSY